MQNMRERDRSCLAGCHNGLVALEGYLAYKKPHHPRTLQQACRIVVLGGGAVSYERKKLKMESGASIFVQGEF
jgi:hypothetical protein